MQPNGLPKLNFYCKSERNKLKCIKSIFNSYPKRSSISLNSLAIETSCWWSPGQSGPLPAGGRRGLGGGACKIERHSCMFWSAGCSRGVAAGASAAIKTTDVRISTLMRKDKHGNKCSEDNRQSHQMTVELKTSCRLMTLQPTQSIAQVWVVRMGVRNLLCCHLYEIIAHTMMHGS